MTAGREFECDFGFVADDSGICVPFTPIGTGCGGGGQPVCTGADLDGMISLSFLTLLSEDQQSPPSVATACLSVVPALC